MSYSHRALVSMLGQRFWLGYGQKVQTSVIGFSGLILISLSGCGVAPTPEPISSRAAARDSDSNPIAVDVAIAKLAQLQPNPSYTGTTWPYRIVTVRSQISAQVVEISADVGDPVRQGQVLVRLNDEILATEVLQAQAEVAARQAEVASLGAEVNEAQAQLKETQLELSQAETDALRLEQLLAEGAIAKQQAETARTLARTLAQQIQTARQQILTRQQVVEAAKRRVTSQQALVQQAQKRQSYSLVTAPTSGVIMERTLEPGDLAQVGSELLQIGDLSKIKVTMQVSELDVLDLRLGQRATIRLDALPDQPYTGVITRITPAADPVARLLPVEVTMANPQRQITSGLLARVTFAAQQAPRILLPESALQVSQSRQGNQPNVETDGTNSKSTQTVFVLGGTTDTPVAIAKEVSLGKRANNQVEILSGLNPGESVIIRSSKPLKPGNKLRLSLISAPPTP